MHGDISAYEFLFRKYYGIVYCFVRNMLKDSSAAEDIAQDIFMRIWLNRVSLHLVTIEEILSNISSTYGVRIEADIQDSQRDKLYNINYDRTDTVEEVIAIIESLTGAELEIIDGTPGNGDAIE